MEIKRNISFYCQYVYMYKYTCTNISMSSVIGQSLPRTKTFKVKIANYFKAIHSINNIKKGEMKSKQTTGEH